MTNESELNTARDTVGGYSTLLKDYVDYNPPERGSRLMILESGLTKDAGIIFNQQHGPERFHLFFITFVTLHLTALHELAYCWNEAFTDPKTKSLTQNNTNYDTHIENLFKYQLTYIQDLDFIQERLMSWRMNNISDQVSGDFATGWRDGFWEYEFHDTILNSSYQESTQDAGFNEENAKETRRNRLTEAHKKYREGLGDLFTEYFTDSKGEEIKSYAHHLAQEMKPASL